ncbi:SAM-dependent methyltransferase [Streptosporangium sp. NPDC023615]|uniref:SAM-dependent methyltransferase n=1 Tax=Streptosporangium sp. NPDC023615 TaxID=3154794 RepID=UPI00341399C7
MTNHDAVSEGIDPSTPSVARMYDYYLGGKDNFASDREAAEQFIQVLPGIRQMVRENRAFLSRSVEFVARQGVDQFLDIGSGLPTRENVHEVAHRVTPEARVVYVDIDPIVLSHGRALLEDNPHTSVVQADMREPELLLTHPEIDGVVDFTRPVAVLLTAMLHFVPDEAVVTRILTAIRERLVPGSHVIVSHAFEGDVSAEVHEAGQRPYRLTNAGGLTSRGPERLAELMEGLEILEPGVVPVHAWRPASPEDGEDVVIDLTAPGILGLVGRR